MKLKTCGHEQLLSCERRGSEKQKEGAVADRVWNFLDKTLNLAMSESLRKDKM